MNKVSIITVCFNSSKTIRKTFDSILRQTYPNIEYLVIDGKSSDGTIDIIREYEPLFQGRMKWISESDQGIYDAMNKGIGMVSGDLIGILNSDDYYEDDAVEIMVNAMTEERYQILYGEIRTWRDGKEEAVGLLTHTFLRDRMIYHPACFVTKAVYRDFGGFDIQYPSVADYDFMLRMLEKKEVKFYPVYRLIANFTMGGMCATETAYLDLLKMQRNWRLISKREYKKQIAINRCYHVYCSGRKIFAAKLKEKR